MLRQLSHVDVGSLSVVSSDKHCNYFNFHVKLVCRREMLIEDVASIALTGLFVIKLAKTAVCNVFRRKQRVTCSTQLQRESFNCLALLVKPRLSDFAVIVRSHQLYLDLLSAPNTRFPSASNLDHRDKSLSLLRPQPN
jgi:hypothetical protein